MNHTLIFEFIKEVIASQSGDGDVLIISSNYEELADEFLEYENNESRPLFIKEDREETGIVIYPEDGFNEAIVFAPDSFNMLKEEYCLYDMVLVLSDYI